MEKGMNFHKRLHLFLLFNLWGFVSTSCSALPAAEPTIDVREVQTSVFFTMVAEVSGSAPASTPAPVFTIAPTSTDVSPAEYPIVVASRFQALQAAFMEFIEIHNELTTNPNMSRNMDWYAQAVAALVNVTNISAEIARMNNYPPEYETFHQHMQSVAAEGNLLFSNYMLALDNQDLNAQNQATTNLSKMITSLNEAFAELNRLVPAGNPVPAVVPSPTS
jgi:hypothetical protein